MPRPRIIANLIEYFRKSKNLYTCYICENKPKFNSLKSLKFHNQKYHKNKL